jgi:hypothetical protein
MALSGKKRSGSGSFPPNPTQWDAERNGMAFRSRFGVRPEEPLKPFSRKVPSAILVQTRQELGEHVDEALLVVLFGVHHKKWSAMTIPCEGAFVIIMNETHSRTRQNATLMEEFFHIILQHKPSRVGTCPHTGLVRREFDPIIEKEAYHSAAAALVPYSAMQAMVASGAASADIADHFEVSRDLTSFRLKTCKLYRRAAGNR